MSRRSDPAQLPLFDARPEPDEIPVADPHVEDMAKPRLGGQSRRILERLMKGPATNMELCEVSHRFSARIFDIRQAGYNIITEHDPATGLSVYRLADDREEPRR